MADITKCSGVGCKVKHLCYRYTTPESNLQSWFVEPPGNDENCLRFFPNSRSKEKINTITDSNNL